jgi:hypothetical protein
LKEETTVRLRDVLPKDVPKMINQYEKKNKLKFYVNTNKKRREDPTLIYIQTVIFRHFLRHFFSPKRDLLRRFFCQSAISFRQRAIPFRQRAIDFSMFFAKTRFTSPFYSPKSESLKRTMIYL